MRNLLISISMIPCLCFAQIPVVHINFVSHNEPGDNLQNAIPFNYQRQQVQILADLMVEKNAAWNLETCDGFAIGARNHQGVTNNIFRTLAGPTYSGVIEIDPRNKNITNIADLAWLLDTLGAEPTNTVGGFTYYNEFSEPDWWEYEDTVVGVDHPYFKWKANLLWGAGSLPSHQNDLHDYGIWKPDTTDNFLQHNPERSVWYMGSGCQPLDGFDSTENEQVIISYLRSFLDSLSDGLLPDDRFYCYSITINQSHFGDILFNKVATICDSVNSWGNAIEWNTLTEKFELFEQWRTETNAAYSRWACGEVATGISAPSKESGSHVYPNPSTGLFTIPPARTVNVVDMLGNTVLQLRSASPITHFDLRHLPDGVYGLHKEMNSAKQAHLLIKTSN